MLLKSPHYKKAVLIESYKYILTVYLREFTYISVRMTLSVSPREGNMSNRTGKRRGMNVYLSMVIRILH